MKATDKDFFTLAPALVATSLVIALLPALASWVRSLWGCRVVVEGAPSYSDQELMQSIKDGETLCSLSDKQNSGSALVGAEAVGFAELGGALRPVLVGSRIGLVAAGAAERSPL